MRSITWIIATNIIVRGILQAIIWSSNYSRTRARDRYYIIPYATLQPQNYLSYCGRSGKVTRFWTPHCFHYAQCYPNARGGVILMEKYSTPRIWAIKRSTNGRVRRGMALGAEREECSLTLEPPRPGKEAFHCLYTGSLVGRQMSFEGMGPLPSSTASIELLCLSWLIHFFF